MPKPRTLSIEHDRVLIIEAPNRCEDKGCQHDGSGEEWRTSLRLGSGLVIEQARNALEQHERDFPKSGPYRLVEYVTTTTRTMEVLEDAAPQTP